MKYVWKKMNKTKAIKMHLEKYGYIDTWKAIELYNATRLSAIIHNLRKNYGLNIISERIEFVDIYGTSSHYVKYILIKDKEEE